MPTSDLDLPLLPSAEQIRRREFATVRRGYDPEQVRDYLEAVATQVQTLEKDLKDARLKLESKAAEPPPPMPAEPKGDPYERISKRFAGLIATADREASRIVEEASTEADRVVVEAKTQADRIRVDAQSRAEQDRQQGHEALEGARDEADRLLAGLTARRDLLVGQLQEMQSRLLSVAKDLEVVVESPPAVEGGAETASTEAEPESSAKGEAVTVTDAEDETEAGTATDAEDETEAGTAAEGTEPEASEDLVDPRYEDLWVSGEDTPQPTREVELDDLFAGPASDEDTDTAVDIPDLASIELDFEDDRPDPGASS